MRTNMEIGAQLYTIRLYTQTVRDFERAMKKLADIGYRYVQLSAIGSEVKPEIAREICDRLGIRIVLTHSDVNRILNDTERLIEEHRVMGCNYIGLGSMPDRYRTEEWIGNFVEDFKEPAKKMKEAGMLLMYHNHAFEFEKVNGRYLLDVLLDGFAPDELGFTLDTYWVQTAGGDVCQWIERLKDRIPCVHLKDRGIVGKEAVMAPVMEGNMNFPAIMKALENTSCEYALVEQDTCYESPFVCLEKSYRNLKALGY